MADYAEPESVELDPSDQGLADTVTDAWPDAARSPDPVGAPSGAPAALDRPVFAAPPPLRASQIVAGPPELLRNVAATICGDKRDGDGRLLLTTARFYDSRAPRTIALDPDGEREIGLVVLVALAVAIGAVLFTATLGWPGIVVGVIAVGLVRQANQIATPWLDRLAARTR
jgi:preprotein translocase subunit Sec61beta